MGNSVEDIPEVGTDERQKLEEWAVDFADEMLELHDGRITRALLALEKKLNYSYAARVLVEHVEQCWATRILR